MQIYICIRGPLSPLWKTLMKLYLSGATTAGNIKNYWKESMNVYLAGGNSGYKWAGDYNELIQTHKPLILESYFYLKGQDEWILNLRPFFKDFLLDSGAFTYLNGLKESPNWDRYIDKLFPAYIS